ncbi:hypothetical protein [Rubrivivax rivuli]|uniref:Uncharacterized protein n=1 Tax=Rubrivivax rivuli TaxID=1862385 RepID=A0A437RH57_9BURK|nr:hypothetical protein [Rubrivivax rivuli]RVU46107.1 hypothetical protein EOE66_09575 [Rubrivivax rivuli]
MKFDDLTIRRPAAESRVKLKPVDGIAFADPGPISKPSPDAMARYEAHWKAHPHRALRKGQKGAAQLVSEARASGYRR